MTYNTYPSLSLFENFDRPKPHHPSINMDKVGCIILGGGRGTRLFPLTETICKPGIYFGGRWRLIDVPVSNAINSDINKIWILLQFLSSSILRHIIETYKEKRLSPGFIDILHAEQKPQSSTWYQGTADAVRQNLETFNESSVDYYLILSGDQLYHMDFRKMMQFAIETNADLIVAATPVKGEDASRMGILNIDENHFITDFYEKPKELSILERFRLKASHHKNLELKNSNTPHYLASMGIYLFKRKALNELLLRDLREDFGKHLIPSKVAVGGAYAFIFQDYWEDIGTIESFHKANLALTLPTPPFNCYDENFPIYSSNHHLPPSKIINATITQSIISEGSLIEDSDISHSLIGPRTIIRKGTIIQNSYLIGNDAYTSCSKTFEIGNSCIIRNAIIDKNVSIGEGVRLTNPQELSHFDGNGVYIRDGITIVTRGTNLTAGFTL